MKYGELTISEPEGLIFGKAPFPVKTKRGLTIGGGIVFTELNFTLPAVEVSLNTKNEIVQHYRNIVDDALKRALEFYSNGLVLEFETVVEMTKYPQIGVEIVKAMNDICGDYFQKDGLKTEIRLTPNDLREFDRPPKQRSSTFLPAMLELFEDGARNGGNLPSIESTAGKEISDDTLMMYNMKQFLFSQAVVGVRDMDFLWCRIKDISERAAACLGGDTTYGFGNTAMVLAEKKYIPKVFVAVARIVTMVKTLVAVEKGAFGPDKNCGYEGPFLRAITGIPISMEGKTAACAHFSPLGNIATACADLWSNESVQNIKLLSGMAPTIYLEQLECDCRLMNKALEKGNDYVLNLQNLMVESDAYRDPQALILDPTNLIKISEEIVKSENYIETAVDGALKGIELIETACKDKYLVLDDIEKPWTEILRNDIQSIPKNGHKFFEANLPTIDRNKILIEEYGF